MGATVPPRDDVLAARGYPPARRGRTARPDPLRAPAGDAGDYGGLPAPDGVPGLAGAPRRLESLHGCDAAELQEARPGSGPRHRVPLQPSLVCFCLCFYHHG